MTHRNKSASETTIVARESVIEVMARLVRQERDVTRRFTLQQLADQSGVEKRVIQTWLASEPENQREPKLSDALSVAAVIGKRAVNAVLALIGYQGATPVDEPDVVRPMQVVAESLKHFAVIGAAAVDDRIDHTEERDVTQAADMIIATVLPLSSAGKAS